MSAWANLAPPLLLSEPTVEEGTKGELMAGQW